MVGVDHRTLTTLARLANAAAHTGGVASARHIVPPRNPMRLHAVGLAGTMMAPTLVLEPELTVALELELTVVLALTVPTVAPELTMTPELEPELTMTPELVPELAVTVVSRTAVVVARAKTLALCPPTAGAVPTTVVLVAPLASAAASTAGVARRIGTAASLSRVLMAALQHR